MSLETEFYRTQFITSADIRVTGKCNFSCEHCYRKERKGDMSQNLSEKVLRWIKNPLLDEVIINGGEPRILPNLGEMIKEIKELDIDGKTPFVTLYTNGHGMDNLQHTIKILNNLSSMGVDAVGVSIDKEHRRYIQQQGGVVYYQFFEDLLKMVPKLGWNRVREKYGLENEIKIGILGCGDYVLPIGGARKFTWEERLEGGLGFTQNNLGRIITKLENEFVDWRDTKKFSHCYCYPSILVRNIDVHERSSVGGKPTWIPKIGFNGEVTTCIFGIIPPLGNIKEISPEEAFGKVRKSLLYQILANEGPQGIARKLGWRNEKMLHQQFIERTPCGLCEDLARTNYSDLKEMMDTPK